MFFQGITPDKDKCCGCLACVETCPHLAISVSEDEDGFIMPTVDLSKCVECGACEKVCPMMHSEDVLHDEVGTAYAAVNCNKKILLESSSGGIFSVIAESVLAEGGVVCGAAFDDNLQLCNIIVDNSNDLDKLYGSKYIQSKNNGIFKIIRDYLRKGVKVYYCGTGCQVAALRLYLRKDYDNLITSDILCHGVPPQRVFDYTVKSLESKYKGRVVNYRFRDKSVWGWSCSSSCGIQNGKRIKYIGYDFSMDAYFNAFIESVMYRESCYFCPFAKDKRVGDITLADFWGVENYLHIPNIRNGVSAILVNSEKGLKELDKVRDKINLYAANIEDISKINRTLVCPSPRPKNRDVFFVNFKRDPERTLSMYVKERNIKKRIVYTLRRNKFSNAIINVIKSLKK